MPEQLALRAAGERSGFPTSRECYMLAVDHDCDGIITYVQRVLVPTEFALDSFDAISAAYRSDDAKTMQCFEPSECILVSHDRFYEHVAHLIDRSRFGWQHWGYATINGAIRIPGIH